MCHNEDKRLVYGNKDDDLIYDLKIRYAELINDDPRDMILVSAGTKCKDNRTLKDSGI
jgi:hypothetical protein